MFSARLGSLIKQTGTQPKVARRQPGAIESITLDEIILDSFQPQKAPQVKIDGVPGLPEQVLLLEGEVETLKQTLSLIDAGTHPKIVGHRERLDQLQDRVDNLQQETDKLRPADLSGNQYVDLEKLIRNGDLAPSILQRSFPNIAADKLFPYVEQLSAFLKSDDRLTEERNKLESNLKQQKAQLVEKLKGKQSQLRKLRREDLDQLIRKFFKQHKQQNPSSNAFPLTAWARFQTDVLLKRRYHFTDVEMSEIAEHIWNPKVSLKGSRSESAVAVTELPRLLNSAGGAFAVLVLIVVTIAFGMFLIAS